MASEAMIEAVPETTLLAAANRAFIRRATRFLVGEAGLDQLLDIGSGLPTAGNVHEVAEEVRPGTRVVYVDKDPSVLASGRELLEGHATATIVQGDLREPEAILDDPEVRRLIDMTRPFGVILGGVLMHLEDTEGPRRVVTTIRDRLPSGSHLAHCGCCDPGEPRARELNEIFRQQSMGSRCFRPVADQVPFFDGLELVDPGFVPCNRWRPSVDFPDPDNPVHALVAGGIGLKR